MGNVLTFREKHTRDQVAPAGPDDDTVEWDLDLPSPVDADGDDLPCEALDDALDELLGPEYAGGFGPDDD